MEPGRAGPLKLQLRADGSTARSDGGNNMLSADELEEAFDEHVAAYSDQGRKAAPDTVGTPPIGARRATLRPKLIVTADGDAEHGSLESLLRISVDHGITRHALRSATAATLFSFELFPPTKPEGLPDDANLPAIRLRLTSDDSGRLTGISVNTRRLPNFQAVQEALIGILGDERGPGSIQDMAWLEMDCDATLHLHYVFEAMEATTGFTDKDGQRVALVNRVVPVSWNEALVTQP